MHNVLLPRGEVRIVIMLPHASHGSDGTVQLVPYLVLSTPSHAIYLNNSVGLDPIHRFT